MHVVTIAAMNYLPMARLLASSFASHNPDDTFHVLVVDAVEGDAMEFEEFTVIRPSDLALDPTEFARMAFLYDVTELSTALKPWALDYLLEQGADVAVYLDPDIQVYSSLADIATLAREHGLVLTPHTTVPMQRDGLRPSEADIMGSGIYNLGFIAVGAQVRTMLSWWQDRLRRDSISAPERMLFTDQRWIDMVPGYYPHHILRDPGYNVAYWNLDNRELARSGEMLTAGGSPLRFFHFSGYSPRKPWILSKYVADNPRVVLSEHPLVQELCDDYGSRLIESGADDPSAQPYRYNFLPDGSSVPTPVRRLYRRAVIEADSGTRDYPASPFDPGRLDEFVAWLREPVRQGSIINRMMQALWEERLDLQRAFPHPHGADEAAFVAWAATSGVREGGVVAAALPTPSSTPLSELEISDEPGVNLHGYFSAELGVGQSGRLLIDAVSAAGIPYSVFRSVRTISRQEAEFVDPHSSVLHPINVAVINADQFPDWGNDVGPEVRDGRYNIGVWAWELEEFPDSMRGSFALVDEVWAVSEFTKAAIQRTAPCPVHVFPHPAVGPTVAPPLDREALGLPEGEYFAFCFDFLSVFERKNPLGLINAFTDAFSDGEGPFLVIKAINGDRLRSDRERLRRACSARSDIYLIEDYLPHDAVDALIGNALAYVSLHRSEGFGLTLMEAMTMGRAVIATGYSGNLDFMDESNSLLVPYTPIEVGADSPPYASTAHWADPDLDVASEHMKALAADPAAARRLGEKARRSVLERASTQRAADFVATRVAAISHEMESGSSKRHQTGAQLSRSAQDAVAAARKLVHTAPDVHTPSRLPGLAPKVRNVVYRALAHHDEQVNLRLDALGFAAEKTQQAAAVRLEEIEANQISHEAFTAMAHRHAELDQIVSIDGERIGMVEQGVQEAAARDDIGTARTDLHEQRLDELAQRSDVAVSRIDLHDRRLDEIADRLIGISQRIDIHDYELVAKPYQALSDTLDATDFLGRPTLGYEGSEDAQAGSYASFEDVFRGTSDFIADRLRPYLPLVAESGPVLDVGCGRGEFLHLLREQGTASVGIDLDESMLQRCKDDGLDAIHGDAIEYLASVEENSLGAITSFQVVEHVSTGQLRELFKNSFRALRPGGLLIAETVNPHSPGALKTFWLDLTHVRPLYPESLLFLARECGFASAHIFFPHGSDDLDANLRGAGEYALVARRMP